MENARSRVVRQSDAMNVFTDTRRKSAVHSVANSADVPDADNRFKVNFAAYGPGVVTTGAWRRIWPSRPGHPNTIVALSSNALKGGNPHSSTKMTNRM